MLRFSTVFRSFRTNMHERLLALGCGLLLALLSGCASTRAPANDPLAEAPVAQGYRTASFDRGDRPEALMLGLSFSGGGARAAAFAYGVLEELARTTVEIDGRPRRLIDLVDHISAVSGGSYTAMYYGLFGDRLFSDFETRFLKRNLQSEITSDLLSFDNAIRMTSPYFGRSDVVAEFLDRELFDGRTFGDLEQAIRQNGRPFILINATDMARTNRFEFTQDQFDLICSDLAGIKVARAVAASGAVPVIFTPITLTNFAGRCTLGEPAWISRALADRSGSIRRYAVAADLHSYRNADRRRYIHLIDGGLSDNLGLRATLDRLAVTDATELADTYRRPDLRRLVQIVVNAQASPGFDDVDARAEVPTLKAIAFAVGNTTDRYAVETLAHARTTLQDAAQQLTARRRALRKTPPDATATLIEVAFDELGDENERAYFNALPTNFNLPPEAIDRLREAGARLLRESPGFQSLLRELPALH